MKQGSIISLLQNTDWGMAGHQLSQLQTIQKKVPGSVSYTVHRYQSPALWEKKDQLLLLYSPAEQAAAENNTIQLRYCVSGNFFCREKLQECDHCKWHQSSACIEKIPTVDYLEFSFSVSYLQQFVKSKKKTGSISEQILAGQYPDSFSFETNLNNKTSKAIEAFLNHHYTDTRENIFINAQAQMLLLYAMEMLSEMEESSVKKEAGFLKYAEERDKVIAAREILLENIGNPITIKALSRKVAMNQCYLKKGFKEIFGTTIFDFYQGQRMEHAKYLLYEKGLTVTEVSASLGYSSISHFSTAFKKHTGLKPCELLIR